MSELLGLVGFAFVGSITPGPNNSPLLASGLRFGFRQTARHAAGTAAGMGALIPVVAGGIGVVLMAEPGADLALKVIGPADLSCLAFRIASSRGSNPTVVSRPLGSWTPRPSSAPTPRGGCSPAPRRARSSRRT